MSGYGQFCPVALAAEVFAERWTPLILRELLCGSHRFNELVQGLPRMSQALLSQRLRQLARDGIVERRPTPTGRGWLYYLTPAGEEFAQVVERLGEWGQRWAVDHLDPQKLDPPLLMWAMHRDVNRDTLPAERVVMRFDFRGVRDRFWMILTRPDIDVCLKDPGIDVDLLVTADLMAMTKVYLGRLGMAEAIDQRLVELDGPPHLARAFPSWIGVSSFAQYGRPRSLTQSGG